MKPEDSSDTHLIEINSCQTKLNAAGNILHAVTQNGFKHVDTKSQVNSHVSATSESSTIIAKLDNQEDTVATNCETLKPIGTNHQELNIESKTKKELWTSKGYIAFAPTESKRRHIPKASSNDEDRESCCGHWFLSQGSFLKHLFEKSKFCNLHKVKLIDRGMELCSICDRWVADLRRHMKKQHDIFITSLNDVSNCSSNKQNAKKDGSWNRAILSKSIKGSADTVIKTSKPCPQSKKYQNYIVSNVNSRNLQNTDNFRTLRVVSEELPEKLSTTWNNNNRNVMSNQTNLASGKGGEVANIIKSVVNNQENQKSVLNLDSKPKKLKNIGIKNKKIIIKPSKITKNKKTTKKTQTFVKYKKLIMKKKGFRNNGKRRKLGYNSEGYSTDSNSSLSESSSESESDENKNCVKNIKKEEEFKVKPNNLVTHKEEINEIVPVVDLNLFTLFYNEKDDLSVFLTEPNNPNFKIFADTESIYVGDRALEDITNLMPDTNDECEFYDEKYPEFNSNNNIFFLDPKDSLFQEINVFGAGQEIDQENITSKLGKKKKRSKAKKKNVTFEEDKKALSIENITDINEIEKLQPDIRSDKNDIFKPPQKLVKINAPKSKSQDVKTSELLIENITDINEIEKLQPDITSDKNDPFKPPQKLVKINAPKSKSQEIKTSETAIKIVTSMRSNEKTEIFDNEKDNMNKPELKSNSDNHLKNKYDQDYAKSKESESDSKLLGDKSKPISQSNIDISVNDLEIVESNTAEYKDKFSQDINDSVLAEFFSYNLNSTESRENCDLSEKFPNMYAVQPEGINNLSVSVSVAESDNINEILEDGICLEDTLKSHDDSIIEEASKSNLNLYNNSLLSQPILNSSKFSKSTKVYNSNNKEKAVNNKVSKKSRNKRNSNSDVIIGNSIWSTPLLESPKQCTSTPIHDCPPLKLKWNHLNENEVANTRESTTEKGLDSIKDSEAERTNSKTDRSDNGKTEDLDEDDSKKKKQYEIVKSDNKVDKSLEAIKIGKNIKQHCDEDEVEVKKIDAERIHSDIEDISKTENINNADKIFTNSEKNKLKSDPVLIKNKHFHKNRMKEKLKIAESLKERIKFEKTKHYAKPINMDERNRIESMANKSKEKLKDGVSKKPLKKEKKLEEGLRNKKLNKSETVKRKEDNICRKKTEKAHVMKKHKGEEDKLLISHRNVKIKSDDVSEKSIKRKSLPKNSRREKDHKKHESASNEEVETDKKNKQVSDLYVDKVLLPGSKKQLNVVVINPESVVKTSKTKKELNVVLFDPDSDEILQPNKFKKEPEKGNKKVKSNLNLPPVIIKNFSDLINNHQNDSESSFASVEDGVNKTSDSPVDIVKPKNSDLECHKTYENTSKNVSLTKRRSTAFESTRKKLKIRQSDDFESTRKKRKIRQSDDSITFNTKDIRSFFHNSVSSLENSLDSSDTAVQKENSPISKYDASTSPQYFTDLKNETSCLTSNSVHTSTNKISNKKLKRNIKVFDNDKKEISDDIRNYFVTNKSLKIELHDIKTEKWIHNIVESSDKNTAVEPETKTRFAISNSPNKPKKQTNNNISETSSIKSETPKEQPLPNKGFIAKKNDNQSGPLVKSSNPKKRPAPKRNSLSETPGSNKSKNSEKRSTPKIINLSRTPVKSETPPKSTPNKNSTTPKKIFSDKLKVNLDYLNMKPEAVSLSEIDFEGFNETEYISDERLGDLQMYIDLLKMSYWFNTDAFSQRLDEIYNWDDEKLNKILFSSQFW